MEKQKKNAERLKHITHPKSKTKYILNNITKRKETKMIEIIYNNIEKIKEEKTIKKVIQTALEEEQIKHQLDIYITLTNNEEIHKINKEHRNIDRPTDVLSFPMFEKEDIKKLKQEKKEQGEEILGDIIISIPKAQEQAEEYGHSFERELSYLVAHGMLHLLGYDHIKEEEKEIMRTKEEEILKKLNITRNQ